MRTLSALSLAAIAAALAVVNHQYELELVTLLVSVALLAVLAAMVWFAPGHAAWYALAFVTVATSGLAAAAIGTQTLLLSQLQASVLGLLMAAVALGLCSWARGRVRRVYPHELLLLSNRFVPGARVVAGPAHVLPFLEKILAEMPRYKQEQTLVVRRVNTRPQPGPLGHLTQNIDQIVVELVYQLDDRACFRAFGIHNRDAIFKAAAQALGKSYLAALRDKEFWVQAWRQAMSDVTERLVRTAVHRSGLTAMQVSEQRGDLEAALLEALRGEAADLGLTLLECSFAQVEPDEAAAALAGREALLQTFARVEEIKLAGEAQAGARAAQVRAMVEAVKAAGGQVPQRIVELIVHGVLPHTVLGAYVPAGLGGDALLDLQARPGGRPGDPTRN